MYYAAQWDLFTTCTKTNVIIKKKIEFLLLFLSMCHGSLWPAWILIQKKIILITFCIFEFGLNM